MSPLPTELSSHWWQRPGRYPGREQYHWHMLFHDQPAVRELAAGAQERLTGFAGLDAVPPPWLHLTTYVVGFVDEVSDQRVEAMVGEAGRLLARVAPIPVRLGRILYHPEAVMLAIEPLGALEPVLEAVLAATAFAGCEGHTDTDPWVPHVSVAYSSGTGPAAPIIEALGTRLPEVQVTLRTVSLVAQTQVGHSWQWRRVAEVPFAGH
ncbi:MAG TPA: 2'-5' RNA ligase family protein [Terriglobales bacterium]|nr:2'-5' RNA ligase family protein [Terriglobales bacterium]